MVAVKTNKKEARKRLIASKFGIDTVVSRNVLYNKVKNNSLFKGTKDNKQLVTNALVALVKEGMLQRNGSKKNSTYKLSDSERNDRIKAQRPKKVPMKTPSEKGKKPPYEDYMPPQRTAKTATQKGLLTGLTSQAVRMIMLQKKIEDTVLSHLGFKESKEAAELISEYVLIAAQMMTAKREGMQPQ